MFALNKYLDRGAEGQTIVHCHVLEITLPKPTLNLNMIVEDIRLIICLNQVHILTMITQVHSFKCKIPNYTLKSKQ